MSSEKPLSVSVAYGDVKVEFSGSPDVVFRSLHEFISKEIPNIELAKSIALRQGIGYQTVLKQAMRKGLRRAG